MRRLIAIVAFFSLVSCYGTGKHGGDAALAVYDFGQPVRESSLSGWHGKLAVEVRAPLWIDSPGIGYRLDYAEPKRLREYTQSRWAGPPAQLVQQRLVRQLGLIPVGQGGARCVLRVDIDEFSQVFETPGASQGVIQARVQLLDRSRISLATQQVNIEKPAPSADARGGVVALTAAVDQLVGDILVWEQQLTGSGKAAPCVG